MITLKKVTFRLMNIYRPHCEENAAHKKEMRLRLEILANIEQNLKLVFYIYIF